MTPSAVAIPAGCFPPVRRRDLLASIFASDLRDACEAVFEVFGAKAQPATAGGLDLAVITLPITVPVHDDGVIVLSTGHVEAPRCPARLTVARVPPVGRDGYVAAYVLAREGGESVRLPGLEAAAEPGSPASLQVLAVAVAAKGMVVSGFDPAGEKLPIQVGEDTARLLSTALLITVGVKVTKAERGEL